MSSCAANENHAASFVAALEALSNLLTDDIELLSVHRDQLLSDLLLIYDAKPDTVFHQVKVQFVGEPGDDLGGLTKDLYTLAWSEMMQNYFGGESAVVPQLPLYKHAEQRPHYRVIGRIIAHSIALLKTLPPRLSRCTMLCLAFGADQVSDEMLLSDFRFTLLFSLPVA